MEKEGTLGAVGVEHLSVPPGTLRARTGIQFYRVIAEPNRSTFEVLLS